ncbi:MAG: aspartate 1-decarboxylase [Cytophagales bacterium]|nr:aspartate 1-decarboxylase [Cytophagales bacterium]
MQVHVLKSKIHGAIVTHAHLDYIGSLGIDTEWLEKSGIAPYEKIQVLNLNNGERLETYAIQAPRGSKEIRLNGASARKGLRGDKLIIMAYGIISAEKINQHQPKVLLLNDKK